MKRITAYALILITVMASCKKEDDPVFDQTPEERINKVLGDYAAALEGSAYGWNGVLKTGKGGVYHFHFSFDDNNRVQMYGDVDTTSAIVRKESSYRLKALQQPSLIFDTYNYLHQLADPDGSVNEGDYGEGLTSDFEFSLDTLTTDSIKLTGRFKNTKMVLYKATQADLQAWQNGDWNDAGRFEHLGNRILHYFKRLQTGGRAYELRVDPAVRTISFTWLQGSTVMQHTSAYTYSSQGLVLETPLPTGVSRLSNIEWDAGSSLFRLNVNGTGSGTIAGAIAPVKVDLAAPSRWWNLVQNRDEYWVSYSGWHVNGVDDAFKMWEIPNFYQLIFYPTFFPDYDLAGYVLRVDGAPTLEYGIVFVPTFTAGGRVIFDYVGDISAIPPEIEDGYVSTILQFWDPQGFYLVQTSETSYDMVSARDAKAWITWIR